MVTVVATICVQRWFNNRRALASGLLYCGLSLGSFIWLPISKILIGEYKIDKNDLESKLTLSHHKTVLNMLRVLFSFSANIMYCIHKYFVKE